MSRAAEIRVNNWIERPDLTGAPVASPPCTRGLFGRTDQWQSLWAELFRPAVFWKQKKSCTFWHTAPVAFTLVIEALPTRARAEEKGSARTYLTSIESVFQSSVSDLARILRVSRPMVYHYREGMEPSVENLRRLTLIGTLAAEQGATVFSKDIMYARQPEGRSLFEYLSDESVDLPTVRKILHRSSVDLAKRRLLAAQLAEDDVASRTSVMRTRHASGKPIYVSDPNEPDKVIQIRPDQTRVRGRIVNREFVPDGE
jgi:hypothetical protein